MCKRLGVRTHREEQFNLVLNRAVCQLGEPQNELLRTIKAAVVSAMVVVVVVVVVVALEQ